jgi:hypothetical protein
LIVLLLIAALPLMAADPLSASRCKKAFTAGSTSQFVGRAIWVDDAQNTLVGSTEDRTVGRSVLTCNVKLPAKSSTAVLDFGGARVAFEGKDAVGGLEITASAADSSCTISGLRTSREKWIELGPAAFQLQFKQPVDRVRVVFTLTDSSPSAAIRVDVNPVVVRASRPGETPLQCPQSMPLRPN